MKTLPDHPHLNHLRRQAKELLAGLRDSDSSASLTDAQATLARRYGFDSWAELKAEAERQRGRFDTAPEPVAQEIADRFGLGRVIAPMRSVARPDDSGRPWVLETDTGRWAVRTMDTWWPIVDADTDVALQRAAAAAGIALPAPRLSRSGAVHEKVGEHVWRVTEWAPTGPSLVAPVGAAVTEAIGGVFATLHGLAIPVDRISPYHGMRLSAETWPELAARAHAAAAPWAEDLDAVTPEVVALEAYGSDGDSAPSAPVLTHNSLQPGNVRLRGDGRPVIIGWHHAGGQPPEWELAEALVHWAVDPGGSVNVAGAVAMLEGYRAVAGALPPMGPGSFRGAITALANYVYGEATEALTAGEAERAFADRKVRHLLAHLPSRATLEDLLGIARAVGAGQSSDGMTSQSAR